MLPLLLCLPFTLTCLESGFGILLRKVVSLGHQLLRTLTMNLLSSSCETAPLPVYLTLQLLKPGTWESSPTSAADRVCQSYLLNIFKRRPSLFIPVLLTKC